MNEKIDENSKEYWNQMNMDIVFDSLEKISDSITHLKISEVNALMALLVISISDQTDNDTLLTISSIENQVVFFEEMAKNGVLEKVVS